MEPEGTMTFSTGEKYWGMWRKNKREGYGEQTYPDGTMCKGPWENDMK